MHDSPNLSSFCSCDRQAVMKVDATEAFIFPTSFAQQRLWFLQQLAPGNPFYNVSAALRLQGSLNVAALEQTFNEIVRRHETLRTTFIQVEGEPVQAIAPSLILSIPIIDLRHLLETQREADARRLAALEAQRPFDFVKGPLLRVKLLQLAETEYVLLLNLHHIIADGWSIGVLIRELAALYNACVEGKPSPLPELSIQYADFAEWQREWLQNSVLETQLIYWRQQLQDISGLNLPTDWARPAIPSYRGAKQSLKLSPSLNQALETLSQQQGVTLFITLLAAFKTLLYRYTQQEDIAIGSPIANRNRSEIEGLIGFFVNSLVLRTQVQGNLTFLDLLSRVKEVALGAYAHQDLPFEKIVEALQPERDLSTNPLFQVSFSLQNTPIEALELPGLSLSLLDVENNTAKLDLEFHLWQESDSLQVQAIYSTDLFSDRTITRMLGHFQTLLEGIVSQPNQLLYDLPLLTSEENQLFIDWNDTKKARSQDCFHQLFEKQVEKTPDAIAVVFVDTQSNSTASLTYRKLNQRANQLAHYLQKIGVVPDVLVGICLDRSLDMIVGLLGIHKAGAGYLPLDPTYPQERLNFMLEDAQVSVLLTCSSLKFPQVQDKARSNPVVVCLDTEWQKIVEESQDNPKCIVTPNHLAYTIYTSGSTGQPKGVIIEHRGLSNLAAAQRDVFNIQECDRILQFASFSFDASIFEIVLALQTGAALYLATKETLLPGKSLIQFLQKNAITGVTLPPTVLAALSDETPLPALQTIICAGETCSQDIVERWALGRRFFNAYGPTEATVWSTISEIRDRTTKPLIGRPIANTQVYILDRHLQPVPIGVPGELYLGGDGLARGYLHRPNLTTERFIANPFFDITSNLEITLHKKISSNSEKLYKTGDLVRYREEGNIEFLGRIDNQVKIRGYRIELGEIEATLLQHTAVKDVVVSTIEDREIHKRLVAYIVLHQESTITIVELRQFLKKHLPEYAIPSSFMLIDDLPITSNGKVNIKALQTIFSVNKQELNTQIKVDPRNPIEKAIAQIWIDILHLDKISIHDNFFDLGGDSLLAVRVIEQIQKQLNREIPLSALFLNPTVADLADSLKSQRKPLPWSPLVAIQPQGSKQPFFCIHPIFGVVFPYYELAFHLGKDQPFYGLQPLGMDGKHTPLNRMEDMAAYYIEALRNIQPNGPYFIGGWSFGGLVAFEMAQQLVKAGNKVAQLIILDTYAPIPKHQPSLWESLKFLFTIAGPYIWPFLRDYLHLLSVIPPESRLRILHEVAIGSILQIYQANSQAVHHYKPKPYPNPITLLRTTQPGNKIDRNRTMGWNELAAEVEVHLLPGNHLTMLRKPHVQVLAQHLSQMMRSQL